MRKVYENITKKLSTVQKRLSTLKPDKFACRTALPMRWCDAHDAEGAHSDGFGGGWTHLCHQTRPNVLVSLRNAISIWVSADTVSRRVRSRSTSPTRCLGVIREKKARCSMPGSGCLTWGASLRLVRKFGKVDISAWVVYKKSGSSTAGFAVFTRFVLQNFFNLIVWSLV